MSKKSIYHRGTMNKVSIIGGLKEVPELKRFDDGVMAAISLATSFTGFDAETKTYIDKTEWHRVVLYDELAEELARIGRPGMRLLVEGPLRRRDYKDADGNVTRIYEVIANNLHAFSAIYKAGEADSPESDAQGEAGTVSLSSPEVVSSPHEAIANA